MTSAFHQRSNVDVYRNDSDVKVALILKTNCTAAAVANESDGSTLAFCVSQQSLALKIGGASVNQRLWFTVCLRVQVTLEMRGCEIEYRDI